MPRKKKEANGSAGHNSDIRPDQMADAHAQLTKLEGVLETAKARLKQKYADLKDVGFNLVALKRARKDLRADPLEQQLDFETYTAYRDMLGVAEAVQAAQQAEEHEANEASVDAAEAAHA